MYQPNFQIKKKPRTNWKKEIKKERERVLSEVVLKLREHQRTVPNSWQDGYNSAVSQVEILKNG